MSSDTARTRHLEAHPTRRLIPARILAAALALAASGGVALAATGGLPQGAETVALDPARFTTTIDNPYFPLAPGSRWIYRGTRPDGSQERVVVTVTSETKRIANGITARVVRDVVSEVVKGRRVPVEVTDDYYAQDRDGNVWYLGESTQEYVNGKPGTRRGSFEAGRDGGQAGIAMPAKPVAGLTYRQEYLKGEAEDKAEVIGFEQHVQVAAGRFRDALVTRDLNALEPLHVEHKFYAKGVGPVLVLGISGTNVREELVRFRRGR